MLTGLSNNSTGTANLATTSYLYNSQGLNEALNFLTSTGTALATENFSYDGDLRPAGGTATWQSGSGNTVGSTIFNQGIGYDAAGNVISQTITQAAVPGQTGSGGSETQNFCYDEQNRLIWSSNHSTTKPTGSITCGSVAWQSTLGGNYTNNFTYTHLGQLWKGPLNGIGPYQYLYCNATSNADQHQLTTVAAVGATCANPGTTSYSASYDSWGNITSRTSNSVTSSYTYDGRITCCAGMVPAIRRNGTGTTPRAIAP